MNYFSTHTGAGGACIAAKSLGLNLVGGIELDPYPVELYRANFSHSIRHESILATPINDLPDFDFFWTSPSCTKFSGSNREGGETELDIEIAAKIAEIIKIKRPQYIALENVRKYLYKCSKKKEFTNSFAKIINAIEALNYNYNFAIYNARDFGSPQDRDRLILRASLDSLPPIKASHSKTGDLFLKPWNGWHSAVKELLDSCKDTFLTENQLLVLQKHGIDPANPGGNFILERVGYGNRGPIIRSTDEQSWTIRSAQGCDEKGGYRSPITALLDTAQVKALDYRCLARLQGFPDWYKWGLTAGRNCKAIGNAVPIPLAEAVIRSLVR